MDSDHDAAPYATYATDACRAFDAHWQRLRAGRTAVPSVRDFLDVLNTATQPYSMLIDVVDAETLKVRLFAAGLAEKAGLDVTNQNLHAFALTPQISRNLGLACMGVSRHPCGMGSTKRAITAAGREVTVEMVSFPLAPADGGVPAVCTAKDVVERLSIKEGAVKVVGYLTARWLDVGFGVPARSFDAA
jgi:hypothetical protein